MVTSSSLRLGVVLGPMLLLAACQTAITPSPREANFAISPTAELPALQEPEQTPPEAPATTAPPQDSAAPSVQGSDTPPPVEKVHPDLIYSPNLYRRWGINLGGAAYSNFDTHLSISTPVLLGASLDLEETLGVTKSASIVRVDAFYNFNRRHGLEFSYYDIARDGQKTVAEDIEVGDVILPAGVINTKFDTTIFKFDYRYNFVADYRTTIAASVGLHTMRIDTALNSETFAVEESFKATAPLPLIGIHAAYALSPKWKLSTHVEFLQLSLGNYSGGIRDVRVSLDHDWFDHVGWGIGFNGFDLDARIDGEEGLSADIGYSYAGLMLYIRAFW